MNRVTEYKVAMKEAERLALELDDARNASPKSPRLTGLPRQGCQATLDLQMEIIEAAEKRFEAARRKALERLSELEDAIDQLDTYELQAVLYFRHIYGLKWAEVSERMHWSESTVRRIHARALRKLSEKQEAEDETN